MVRGSEEVCASSFGSALNETVSKGLEDIVLDDVREEFVNNDFSGSEEEYSDSEEFVGDDAANDDAINDDAVYFGDETFFIHGLHDFGDIKWDLITKENVMNFKFSSLRVGYMFYNWYGRMRGFAARMSKKIKNKDNILLQQTFVCHRAGFRDPRYKDNPTRVREARPDFRCGCEAKIRIHILEDNNVWEVRYFDDDHNHLMCDDSYNGLHPAHRKMKDDEIMQMNNMRRVGINTPTVYSSFASQSGTYDRVRFIKKDMYNQLDKQRRKYGNDANAALEYLRKLSEEDNSFFSSYTLDEDSRLQHLFWCDGTSQMDYALFGDVLAFDATYGKNKYFCPLVVFFGVNHHNRTTVFAFAVVADETEETYVWLLEQFLLAMKGKSPGAVITDGDKAMRNAIRRIFPNAYHRLCAWHLLRNATSNIAKPKFTRQFKRCMMDEDDIGQFKCRWNAMVKRFGVENHQWVLDTYEKREMWSKAYIRGKFFAGYQTTSRCEGLHSQILKFVHSRYNLHEFLQHLTRLLSMLRFNEKQDDYASNFGDRVLQTNIRDLERSASLVYTKNIFLDFRDVLVKSSSMCIVECKEMQTYNIFKVCKQNVGGHVWHVSFFPRSFSFKCSYLTMESDGLPCEHIMVVLVYLDIKELPDSLILSRWTKTAKKNVQSSDQGGTVKWDSMTMVQYEALLDFCRQMCNLSCRHMDLLNGTRELVAKRVKYLEGEVGKQVEEEDQGGEPSCGLVKDPTFVRTKGCSSSISHTKPRSNRVKRCGICRVVGHNRKTCTMQNDTIGIDHGEENGYADSNDLRSDIGGADWHWNQIDD